ncbi:tyrosine-type recombinase/integrase [Natronosporangium hydrolyticum]|uniref:Tyrosine-type recombinase/integrase n=1 Tax=Natronosporangium hydrolyticum TaxID=2811111 RepID=A0A895Y568_9ACTN|nr:site-specific integrase [Natronosporangium hydrolyticum]QSB12837.1 tyrosine-type recombinase/integrase [Natronosporangium hydrolyticum]
MSGTTRRKPGWMGPYIESLRAWLLERGYAPGSIKHVLTLAGQLGRWMQSSDVKFSQLDSVAVESFLDALRARGVRRVPGPRGLRPLLDYLDSEGALAFKPVPDSPVEQLVAEYRTWLVIDRGLAAPTVLRYENLARRFLGQQRSADGGQVAVNLTAADVVGFLLRESERVSVGAVKGRVAELRSLLRFLHLKGLTPTALASAVPPAAGWHDTGIPVGLASADVQRLLDGCDRASPTGVRNFAILLLVARLGLRSIEVARLELGDFDWRAGEIAVAGKARRRDRLPLPHDVGQALTAYLREVRPVTSIRQVFLMLKAPIRPIRADLVGDVTRRACRRAGLPEVGPHRLRHALATEMLRRGAKLVEISQVLRHRDLATTAVYAKVDLDALRRIAQPWPGARR